MLLPYAPQFEYAFKTETSYEFEVETNEAAPCFYVLASNGGREIDLSFYFFGALELDAATLTEDASFQAMLTKTNQLLALADIEFGEVVYRDASPEDAARFRVIRDLSDVRSLLARGKPTSVGLAGHRHLGIFVVETLLNDTHPITGFSGGVPGPAGLHGHSMNGMVITLADLQDYPDSVSHTLAHEISHYLGLRHTTEIVHRSGTAAERLIKEAIDTTDPLDDTAVCDSIFSEWETCPDRSNLMFPALPDPDQNLEPELSPSQALILKANPLVH